MFAMEKISYEYKMQVQALQESFLDIKQLLHISQKGLEAWLSETRKRVDERGLVSARKTSISQLKIAWTDENVEHVATQEGQPRTSKSTCQIAKDIAVSWSSVHKVVNCWTLHMVLCCYVIDAGWLLWRL